MKIKMGKKRKNGHKKKGKKGEKLKREEKDGKPVVWSRSRPFLASGAGADRKLTAPALAPT